MYQRYSLILMLTHACSLRCSYCYAGAKSGGTMPFALGAKAIDRAIASIGNGGELQLGFFGGEPLLETALLTSRIDHAAAPTTSAQATSAVPTGSCARSTRHASNRQRGYCTSCARIRWNNRRLRASDGTLEIEMADRPVIDYAATPRPMSRARLALLIGGVGSATVLIAGTACQLTTKPPPVLMGIMVAPTTQLSPASTPPVGEE